MPLLLVASPAGAAEARVVLRPERLALGDVAELSFELSGVDLRGQRFAPRFQLENLQIVGGPLAARHDVLGQRAALAVVRARLYVSPERPGRARVYDIVVAVGERELALPERQAWVDERGTAAPAPPATGRQRSALAAPARSPPPPPAGRDRCETPRFCCVPSCRRSIPIPASRCCTASTFWWSGGGRAKGA